MTIASLERVGWIGTGHMGTAMIHRLLSADVEVTVWNRTPEHANEVVVGGAVRAADFRDVITPPIVFTSLAGSADLGEVIDRIVAARSAVEVLVDTSTVSTTASRAARERCADRGIAFLSSPVSGNPNAVATGNAAFVCSGSSSAFDRVHSLLELIGTSATYVGPADEAPLLKICHNLLLAIISQGLSEAIILCEALGVARTDLMTFLNGSALGSRFTAYKTPAVESLDMTATFTMRLLLKDLGLGMAEATQARVPLPLGGLVQSITHRAVVAGYGDQDFFALLLAQAAAAGLTLTPASSESKGTPS